MSSAYLTALGLLARRDLSEQQVRRRLTRKGHDPDDIDAAVVRLRDERAIDDARVAEGIARAAAGVKRRGKLRARREIESAGIASTIARQAVDAVFETVDDDELIEAALRRRLQAGCTIVDEREFQRLFRYLMAQGFETDRILSALNARRGPGAAARDDHE
jgi:regulatory protein